MSSSCSGLILSLLPEVVSFLSWALPFSPSRLRHRGHLSFQLQDTPRTTLPAGSWAGSNTLLSEVSSSTDTARGGNKCKKSNILTTKKKRGKEKKKGSDVGRRKGNHSGEREQRTKACRSKVRDAKAQNDGALAQEISEWAQKYISMRMTKESVLLGHLHTREREPVMYHRQ